MKRLLYMVILLPLFVSAQEGVKGVKFEEALSWEQIKERAKTENKFIFVDVYATWCVPCKMMDKDVYPSERLGAFMNRKYISVKVQIDSTAKDNENIKNWYMDAIKLRQQYDITSLPSFLFFSPEGKIVHRDLGYKSESDFASLAKNAMNPATQLYALVGNYQPGKMSYQDMHSMAVTAKNLNQNELANSIAQDYLKNYLYKLKEEDLCASKDHILFITSFIQSSKEKGFGLFYKYGGKIDKLMGHKGYAQHVVDYVISKEEIDAKLFRDNQPLMENPDWNKMQAIIKRKYSQTHADRTIMDGQLRWYRYKNDWDNLAKYNILKIEKYGLDTTVWGAVDLNNMIWNVIFKHSNDKNIISKGIEWAELLVKKDSTSKDWLDTYANLLYKAGRINEAIQWEEKAVKAAEQFAEKYKKTPDRVFQETLDKMRKGIPTWPNE